MKITKLVSTLSPVFVILFFVLLVGAIVLIAAAPDQAVHLIGGKTGAEYAALTDQLAAANQKITDLTSQVDDLTVQAEELQGQNDELTQNKSDLGASLTTYRALACKVNTWSTVVADSNYSGEMSGSGDYIGQNLSIYGYKGDLFFVSAYMGLDIRKNCIIVNPSWRELN